MTTGNRMKVSGFFAVACLAACTQSPKPEPDDEPDVFLADINNAWFVQGEDNPDHFYMLRSTPPGKVSSAIISGNEILPGTSDAPVLNGMFENRTIHFTSKLGADVLVFDGTFSDERTMDLTVSKDADEDPAQVTLFCFCDS